MLSFDEALAEVLRDDDKVAFTIVPWLSNGRMAAAEFWFLWIFPDDVRGIAARRLRYELSTDAVYEEIGDAIPEYVLAKLFGYDKSPEQIPHDRVFLDRVLSVWGGQSAAPGR